MEFLLVLSREELASMMLTEMATCSKSLNWQKPCPPRRGVRESCPHALSASCECAEPRVERMLSVDFYSGIT